MHTTLLLLILAAPAPRPPATPPLGAWLCRWADIDVATFTLYRDGVYTWQSHGDRILCVGRWRWTAPVLTISEEGRWQAGRHHEGSGEVHGITFRRAWVGTCGPWASIVLRPVPSGR